MKQQILILRVINVIGISNFITINLLKHKISEVIFNFSLLFSSIIFGISIILIIWISVSYWQKLKKGIEIYSTSLTLFFRFLFPNPMIASLLVLAIVGSFYDLEILKILLLCIIIFSYPLIVLNNLMIVTVKNDDLVIYNYLDHFSINTSQLKKISRIAFGFPYRLVFLDGDRNKKAIYFFPKGSVFILAEPESIKSLKSKII